jgi:thiamine biosynthesis protein ThiI
MPLLRPLIGFDKLEIINKARAIDTYDISILPDQDCCALFVPKHPATKARLKDILSEEEKLNVDELVLRAIKNVKSEIFE